jgi:hypothetical protein
MPPRKPKPAPVAAPTAIETAPPAADEQTPAPADTVEEFRVRATTDGGVEFLVKAGRRFASRADADAAIGIDKRRYRWPSAPPEPTYVVEVRTVTRSDWAPA